MTMTHDSLDGLIERVERCTGPDRFLDSRIRAVLEPQEPIVDGCPFYTASLDAALALVERKLPGSHVGLDPIFFVDPESVKWDAVICIARMERWNPVNSDWPNL